MKRQFLLCLTVLLFAVPLGAADVDLFPDKPEPPRLVNDLAGCFDKEKADSLEEALVCFDDSTSNQLCVVTVPDLGGYDIAEYALKIGNKWGVGSNKNNGIIILLKPKGEGPYTEVTIQVGYGLEGAIPDIYCYRIIQNIMGPHLSNQEYFEAVVKGSQELMALAKGEISEPRCGSKDDDTDAMIGLIMLLFIVPFAWVLIKFVGGGGGGGSSSSGSSFGGGSSYGGFGGFGGGWSSGGSSGGGFGGFGGGSFGGGGASGRF